MPDSCLPSPAGSYSPSSADGRKVAISPPLPSHNCRRHGRRSRKQPDQNSAAATVFSFSFAAPGSLFTTDLAGSSKPVAAASLSGRNLVRNRVEFCKLG